MAFGSVKDRTRIDGGSRAKHGRVGPYSRSLARGALGSIDGRSREGRYLRHAERALADCVAPHGEMTTPQRLWCARLARVMLRIELLDEKLAQGKATELDVKILGGLSSQFRLMLRDLLGRKAAQHRGPSLAEHLATLTDDAEAAG